MSDETNTKITAADLESKFREVQGQVDTVADDSKKAVQIGGIVAAVLLILLMYGLGRRSGTRKSTVVQIRRL